MSRTTLAAETVPKVKVSESEVGKLELWGKMPTRAGGCGIPVPLLGGLGHDQNILWFDVTVCNVKRVQGAERQHQLTE